MIVMNMEVLLSTVLGIIFLASAVPKLRHPKGFVLAVKINTCKPPRSFIGVSSFLKDATTIGKASVPSNCSQSQSVFLG